MIMSYYDHFLDVSNECYYYRSVHTTREEVFVTVKRKNCATTFYGIPGFIAVLKIPVV